MDLAMDQEEQIWNQRSYYHGERKLQVDRFSGTAPAGYQKAAEQRETGEGVTRTSRQDEDDHADGKAPSNYISIRRENEALLSNDDNDQATAKRRLFHVNTEEENAKFFKRG
jgi:hypothetical protein